MLKLKKPSWIIIIALAVLAALLCVVLALNQALNAPLAEMKMVYEENPAHWFKDVKLMWEDSEYFQTHVSNAKRGREIGFATDEYSTWRIYEMKGYDHDYLYAAESEDVWRVFSSIPPEEPFRQYILKNATEKQRFERLLSVTLNKDGTVQLAIPPISSYAMLGTFYYALEDGELLIYQQRENTIVRFEVVDDNTLVFKEASVPLHADRDALYISTDAVSEA